MTPLWIVALFTAIFTLYLSVQIPKEEKFATEVAADVSATNFVAYRKALQKYLEVNPGATGTISDASLAPYWLPGYIRDANWTNVVSGGTLFVYSTTTLKHNTVNSIYQKSMKSSLVGTKNTGTGHLQSPNGFDTGITLPAAIPNNALVILGK